MPKSSGSRFFTTANYPDTLRKGEFARFATPKAVIVRKSECNERTGTDPAATESIEENTLWSSFNERARTGK